MRLKKLYAEKIWGLETLPPPFTSVRDKRIGEIWFEPPEALPEILVKYIFANEKLSVQCHPSDVQTLSRVYRGYQCANHAHRCNRRINRVLSRLA